MAEIEEKSPPKMIFNLPPGYLDVHDPKHRNTGISFLRKKRTQIKRDLSMK